MYTSETNIRARYAETDQMGYVYYGNYASYFEVARVEAIRSLGFSYKKMEEDGIALPVFEYSVKYFKPAYYDDNLRIETTIISLPKARIEFKYKTFNEAGEQINEGYTCLVFVNKETGRPCPAPENFRKALMPYFE